MSALGLLSPRLLPPLLLLGLLVSWVVFYGRSLTALRRPVLRERALRWGELGLDSPLPQPSEPVSPEEERGLFRGMYGGRGDKPHLGGFTDFDPEGVSNNTFNFMLGPLGIRSIVDVGCGRGFSTLSFRERGARVLCVEGSRDAIVRSMLPRHLIVEHDFSKGPWWPSETFDAVWAVEFVEHVGRQFAPNYLAVFRRAALLFVTCSPWGECASDSALLRLTATRWLAPRRGAA